MFRNPSYKYNDAPVEKEIQKFNWGGWLCNLAFGVITTIAIGAFAAVAISAIAAATVVTGGMVLGAAALVGAAVGTGITTAGIAIADMMSGHVRSFGEAVMQTAMGTIGGAVSGVVIYGAYTLIPFFAEAAGNAGIYYFGGALGGNAVPFIQSAATIAGYGLVGTDAIYAVDKIAQIGLKEDILLETIFNGNETAYTDFEMLLMMGNMFYFETALAQKKLSESGKKHPKYDNSKAAEETSSGSEGGTGSRTLRIATEKYSKLIDDIKVKYNAGKTRNAAKATGKIGADDIDLECISGKFNSDNYYNKGNFEPPQPDNYHYEGSILEYTNHTEQKIVEYLRVKYKDNNMVTGEIELISERAYCDNCKVLVDMFEKEFPNIKVIRVEVR